MTDQFHQSVITIDRLEDRSFILVFVRSAAHNKDNSSRSPPIIKRHRKTLLRGIESPSNWSEGIVKSLLVSRASVKSFVHKGTLIGLLYSHKSGIIPGSPNVLHSYNSG